MAKAQLETSTSKSPPHASRILLAIAADARADAERQAAGLAPRRDYALLADTLDAEIADYSEIRASRLGRRIASTLGRRVAQALTTLRRARRYDILFSDNEYAGTLLGLALRWLPNRPRHVLLAHHLTPKKKRMLAKLARPGVDTLIVHCEAQEALACAVLGFRRERIQVLPYQVDTHFWHPQSGEAQPNLICTVGLECRDYDTLLAAVDGLNLEVRIGAASNWSRKQNSLSGRTLPPSVVVTTYDYVALRELYANSAFAVVPLLDVDFQAGVTTILEAMAMGKAVIATQNSGQRDVIIGPVWTGEMHGWPDSGPSLNRSTGIYTLPGDADAMRSAMRFLLDNAAVAEELGRNGRRRVEAHFTVEQFAERFASCILDRADRRATIPGFNLPHTTGT